MGGRLGSRKRGDARDSSGSDWFNDWIWNIRCKSDWFSNRNCEAHKEIDPLG